MAKKAVTAASTPARYLGVDVLRGTAILLMAAYHFCFDLNYFGVLHENFNDSAFWLSARALIVSLFLFLVGISLVLAAQRANPRAARLRLIKLLAASIAVSLGSFAMFPESFIFFGILHFILVASLIGRSCVRWYGPNLWLGILALAAGSFFAHPLFDTPYLQWAGFMTHKPYTEDYVPLFPWIGVVLIGIFAGRFVFMHGKEAWLAAPANRVTRPAAWLGRHSLVIYLLHQPILLGLLYLLLQR